MSFILNEPTTFLNIKITDYGRNLISSGKFNMSKAVILDREIDYRIENQVNLQNNRVLDVPHYYPDVDIKNLDGTAPLNIKIQSVTNTLTASSISSGFFTGSVGAWTLDNSLTLGKNHIDYATNATNMALATNSNKIILDNPGGSTFPKIGDLIFIPWVHNTAVDYMTSSQAVPPTHPVLSCWYKVVATNSPEITVDRPIINSANGAQTSVFIYPSTNSEIYYGSGSTLQTPIWNFNIVRTYNVLATSTGSVYTSGETSYASYGSIEFSGVKHYFGLEDNYPAIGVLHYSNEYTGNTYAEQLLEKSVEVHLPMIMWHHSSQINGYAQNWGLSLYDYYGETLYDNIARTTYRELKDGISSSAITVGRVYHKLKTIIITDQELLIALSYKSNRNFTFPDFNLDYSNYPKQPLLPTDATGVLHPDYDYFVTYLPSITGYSATVGVSLSFGHPKTMPCGYIKKISGQINPTTGEPYFLKLNFPNPNSFPFMRSPQSWTAATTNGGWSAQHCQILVNEQLKSLNYNLSNLPNADWKKISDLSLGGNGVYSCFANSDSTINPDKLNTYSFIVSKQDLDSGSTYNMFSGITYGMADLNFGDESFFHGVINTKIKAQTFTSKITVTIDANSCNSSLNPTYQNGESVFITEVAILDSHNRPVIVGKPTYPIKKLPGKNLTFQLEYDF